MTEPTLYARMELRLADAEKRLAKFQSTVDKSMGVNEARTRIAASRMDSSLATFGTHASSVMTAVGVATAAGMAVALVAISKTKDALEEFGNIADASAASGLDAEFFQGLVYQASLAGVKMEELSASLATFAKNAGLAVVGKGKMIKALQALNPALLENIRNARSQEERVKLAADAIDKATTASEKAAIATTLFGGAGSKLIAVFNGGAAAIDATAIKARDLGIIVDRELIARADELGDEFDTATRIMDVQFKQALINLAPILVEGAKLAASLAAGITAIIDSMRSLEEQSTRGLSQQMATLSAQRLDIENKILEAQAAQREELSKMSDTAKSLGFGDTQNPVLPGGNIDDLKAQSAELKKQEQTILDILTARNEAAAAAKSAPGTGGKPLDPIPETSSKSRSSTTSEIERQKQAVVDLISKLEFEQSLVGKSEVEQAKMNALREAGAVATEEQKARILALIEATARERAAVDAVQSALTDLNDTAKDVTGTIIRGFRDGASAAEILDSVLIKVSDKLLDMALSQIFTPGPTGFLGKLFGFGGSSAVGGLNGGNVGAPGSGAIKAATAASAARAMSASVNRVDGAGSRGGVHVTVGLRKDGLNIEPEVVSIVETSGRRIEGRVTAASRATFENYRRNQLSDDIKRRMKQPHRKG